MQSLSAHRPDRWCSFHKQPNGAREAVAATIFAFFDGLLGHARAEDAIVSQYEGRGWDDSTERDLNNEIVKSNLSGF
jgi:hypothetical protein